MQRKKKLKSYGHDELSVLTMMAFVGKSPKVVNLGLRPNLNIGLSLKVGANHSSVKRQVLNRDEIFVGKRYVTQ